MNANPPRFYLAPVAALGRTRAELARQISLLGLECTTLDSEQLPIHSDDHWGIRWEALIRELEEAAPVHFIMFDAWDWNWVAQRLSSRVCISQWIDGLPSQQFASVLSLNTFIDNYLTQDATQEFRFSYLLPQLAGGLRKLARPLAVDFWRQLPRSRRCSGRFVAAEYTPREVEYVNSVPTWPDPVAVRQVPGRPILTQEERPVFLSVAGGQISGVDIFSETLVRSLRSVGVDARILGERAMDNQQSLPFADDVPVESLNLPASADWPTRWAALRNHLVEQQPCVYLPNYDFVLAAAVPLLPPEVRVLGVGHSDDPGHYEQLVRLGPDLDKVVVVSDAIRQHLLRLQPSLADRIVVIPYGVSVPAYRPRVSAPCLRILYAGRLVEYQKRTQDLVRIARALSDRQISFQLDIVGEGCLRGQLEEEVRSHNLAERVVFVGKLSNRRLRDSMPAYQVFLLPSAFEGLPVALLEAMAGGLVPVVGAIRSGVPELIQHGENGLLVPVGQTQEFADQLASLAENSSEVARLSQAAWRTIATGPYRLESMQQNYLQALSELDRQPLIKRRGRLIPPPGVSLPKESFELKRLISGGRRWLRQLG